jgi:membrane protease YdiL (CAAX protease family)
MKNAKNPIWEIMRRKMSTDAMDIEHDSNLRREDSVGVRWGSVGLYLLLTFVLSWAAFIGLRATGLPLVVYAAVGMFGPALAALLTRLMRREGFADAGLRLVGRGQRGGGWMFLAAYFVPPLLIAASIGFVLLTGYQHWAFSENMQHYGQIVVDALRQRGQAIPQELTPEQLGMTNFWVSVAAALTFGLLINSIFTFGEEFGWRGYLLPKLAPLGGVTATILTGVVWGLWHAPLIILDGYNYPGHRWLGVLMMVVFCVTLGIIQAWLRFRSGSVWPPVLAHAAINAQASVGVLLLSKGDSLLGTPIGLLALVPMIVLAIVLVVTNAVSSNTLVGHRQIEHP